jgi:hypothetical protein
VELRPVGRPPSWWGNATAIDVAYGSCDYSRLMDECALPRVRADARGVSMETGNCLVGLLRVAPPDTHMLRTTLRGLAVRVGVAAPRLVPSC